MAARRGRGSTAVRVIFSQHAEILQYSRKTITGRFYATDRMDALYRGSHCQPAASSAWHAGGAASGIMIGQGRADAPMLQPAARPCGVVAAFGLSQLLF